MKMWIIGLLLVAGSCASKSSSNDDYEIKRFHIQSRQLGGSPQCVEIRRNKRSTREADYVEKIDTKMFTNEEEDDIKRLSKQVEPSGEDNDYPTEIVIKDSDWSGSSGILIIKSRTSPNVPLVFAVRPVLGNSKNKKYLQMQIIDESTNYDDEGDKDFEDTSNEADNEFEDYPENYEGDKPNHNLNKKSKLKQSVHPQIVQFEEDLMEFNENNSNRNKIRMQILRELLNQNENHKNYRNSNQSLRKVKKNSSKRGMPSANECIIIEKESEPVANEKSSTDSSVRLPNKGYGLRKRYKGKHNY